jgi:hypothetical protein
MISAIMMVMDAYAMLRVARKGVPECCQSAVSMMHMSDDAYATAWKAARRRMAPVPYPLGVPRPIVMVASASNGPAAVVGVGGEEDGGVGAAVGVGLGGGEEMVRGLV